MDLLDETVLEIRTSIFDLQAGDGLSGLRWRLLDLVSELTEDVPMTPTVRMTGTVENSVSDDVGEHVEVVAREAVSNAVRHVRAKELVLSVEAGAELTISVVDDGVGMPPTVARSGLRDLEQRAAGLGGSCAVTVEPGGGTRLIWQVPPV